MLLKTREEIIRLAADGASGNTPLERALFARFIDAFELFQKRHKKYGEGNIARAAATGIVIRMGDKVSRLEEYYLRHAGTDSSDESITDTFLDSINYPAMALVCEAGDWPGAKPTNIYAPKPSPIPGAFYHPGYKSAITAAEYAGGTPCTNPASHPIGK